MTDRTDHHDQTAVLMSHAADWGTGNARQSDAPAEIPVADPPLTTDQRAAALRSARYAARAYPGPVGDLISSTIQDYVLDGRLLEPFSLPHRLVRAMQTMETRSPLPALRGYDHLPATYMPGSGQLWRYRTAPDDGAAEPD